MLFSDFIEHTLSGKNDIIWNYYCFNVDADNILWADKSNKFIQQYFKNGAKGLPLLVNPEEAEAFLRDYFMAGRKESVLSFEFDKQYSLPDDRAVHTVSGFFLGLLIEKCLTAAKTLSIVHPQDFPFSYLWFLTFLYHDYGYCVVERADSPLALPEKAPIPYFTCSTKIRSEEYRALKQVKEALGINISPFSPFPWPFGKGRNSPYGEHIRLESALLRELTQRSCTIEGFPKIQFNTGTIIKGHQYTSTTVMRYFNYCINERSRIDHGIVGGYLFYDRMIKNYLSAYLAVLRKNHHSASLSDFYYRNRRFSQSQLPVFSYIADCILAHNIWKQNEETYELYEKYRLNQSLAETYKTITFHDNPLLYILVVADTLEPTKVYRHVSPKIVSKSIDVEYYPSTRTVSFSSNNPAVDISLLHERAKGLKEWTSARCTELIEGKFTLYL